jgi:hypothetical protein
VNALFASLTEAVRAFRAVFGNPDLRRVELAFVGFNAAELGTGKRSSSSPTRLAGPRRLALSGS